jgi:hypothetical protein
MHATGFAAERDAPTRSHVVNGSTHTNRGSMPDKEHCREENSRMPQPVRERQVKGYENDGVSMVRSSEAWRYWPASDGWESAQRAIILIRNQPRKLS